MIDIFIRVIFRLKYPGSFIIYSLKDSILVWMALKIDRGETLIICNMVLRCDMIGGWVINKRNVTGVAVGCAYVHTLPTPASPFLITISMKTFGKNIARTAKCKVGPPQ